MAKTNIAIANFGKGVGFYVPENMSTNIDIARIFKGLGVTTKHGEPLTVPWMAKHLGRDVCHFADKDEMPSHMGIKAARRAIIAANITPYELNALCDTSATKDCEYPLLACLIQNGLVDEGGPPLRLDAYDISAACTGGLRTIVATKQILMDNYDFKYGLAVATEATSKVINFTDANAQVWGDGAAAVVLEKTTDDRGIICSKFKSIPEAHATTESIGLGTRYLGKNVTPNAWFIGAEVQKFVLQAIEEIIPKTLEKANIILRAQRKPKIYLDDIKMFATHQANSRIFERPARRLNIPLDKFYVNFPG